MKQAATFFHSFFSFAVFSTITLAVAGTTYQLFNPDGAIQAWLVRTWETSPGLLVMMGGIVIMTKRWLTGTQSDRPADMLFYGAILLGLYFGINLLITA